MKQFLMTVIRLVPDPLREEFVNVGIGLREKDGNQAKVFVPEKLPLTKVKSWFPELDHYGLSYFLLGFAETVKTALEKESLEAVKAAFSEIEAREAYNVFKVTPLEIVQGKGGFDDVFEFWKNKMLDLRERQPAFLSGKRRLKDRLERTFKRHQLLEKKVRAIEEPVYVHKGLIPIHADFEWKNGKRGIIKVVSFAEEQIGIRALINRWTEIKATIQEAIMAQADDFDYAVVAPTTSDKESEKMARALKEALGKSKFYDTSRLEELALRIEREGVNLPQM